MATTLTTLTADSSIVNIYCVIDWDPRRTQHEKLQDSMAENHRAAHTEQLQIKEWPINAHTTPIYELMQHPAGRRVPNMLCLR